MKEKAEEWLTDLKICSNGMFRFLSGIKIDSEVEGGIDERLSWYFLLQYGRD